MKTEHKTSHEHASHSHSGHVHAHGGAFTHEPSAAAAELHRQAFDAAQPEPGKKVVAIQLEAHELEWPLAPGATVRAWAYNGQVPGPVIEGRVGDVVQVRTGLLQTLLGLGLLPVISPVSLGDDGGALNINADEVATSVATALSAEELLFLTDVEGVRVHGERVEALT